MTNDKPRIKRDKTMDDRPSFPIKVKRYAETVLKIPADDGLPETVHRLDVSSLSAINAAVAAGRPLLIRGEPGTGKSQLARAAARLLRRRFRWKVVDIHTEVADLFYTFDAVERLARAQVLGALWSAQPERGDDAQMHLLDERRFVRPGPLWWAFDEVSAQRQEWRYQHRCRIGTADGEEPSSSPGAKSGYVVLIDEIDKTDPSVPNGLLEALGQGTFEAPGDDESITLHGAEGEQRVAPLVVITTNEERELPSAFVRRCMVLQLRLPRDEGELRTWLVRRGKAHFSRLPVELLGRAAELVIADRKAAKELGLTPPGQAEYLDMLRAVSELARTNKERAKLLDEIAVFALKKHPELHPDVTERR